MDDIVGDLPNIPIVEVLPPKHHLNANEDMGEVYMRLGWAANSFRTLGVYVYYTADPTGNGQEDQLVNYVVQISTGEKEYRFHLEESSPAKQDELPTLLEESGTLLEESGTLLEESGPSAADGTVIKLTPKAIELVNEVCRTPINGRNIDRHSLVAQIYECVGNLIFDLQNPDQDEPFSVERMDHGVYGQIPSPDDVFNFQWIDLRIALPDLGPDSGPIMSHYPFDRKIFPRFYMKNAQHFNLNLNGFLIMKV